MESANTHWIAVEPNTDNIEYSKTWPWPSRITTCATGLSKLGGPQTLYVTNVDSGSSLLEPVIPASMSRRVRNLDYFFPLQKRSIDTLTLSDVVADTMAGTPIFVKLDTQGTELSILRGSGDLISNRRIIGIELESSLLAQPVMRESGKFWQACEYMEGLGLELIQIKPIYGPSRFGVARPRGFTYLNECDCAFTVRPDIAADLPVDHRLALIAFYLSYELFEEALSWLLEDIAVAAYLEERGCPVTTLCSAIRAAL
jgi:FkbM family methyltransferase